MPKKAIDNEQPKAIKSRAGTKRAKSQADAAQARTPSGKAARKLWRIYRYSERFELRDDDRRCRKSAPQFVRDFVGVMAGNEAAGYQGQLDMLRNSDGEEYWLLFGLYRGLVIEASKRSRAYRGYLLDSANEPLSDTKLAKIFKIHAKKMTRLLRKLEAVELLERVDMPEWDLSLDEVPAKTDDSVKDAGAQQSKKRGSRSKNKGCAGAGGRRAAPAGAGGPPVNNNGNPNHNDNRSLSASEEQQAQDPRPSASATTRPTLLQDETQAQEQAQALKGQDQMQRPGAEEPAARAAERSSAPATAPPIMPTLSDAGGDRVIPFVRPSSSVHHEDGPAHISQAVAGIRRRCNQTVMQAGREIYAALGKPWAEDSPEAARECGCFAAQFEKVMASGLSPPQIVELWESLVKEARRLARLYSQNGGYKSAAKVWCTVFSKKLIARVPTAARSPPESGPA